MARYRIKYLKNLGYFAQTKKSTFTKWQTIGRHLVGFGLYPEHHLDHPMNERDDAFHRIRDYKTWLKWVSHDSRDEAMEYIDDQY